MLHVVDLRVRSLDVEAKEISWRTAEGQEDALDYTFTVLRSESPEGPFDPVSDPFEDRYLFVDRRIPQGDKYRKLWYRIRVVHKASGATTDTESAAQQAEPDLVARYIRRHEQMLFSQFTGRECWLFKVRTFGPGCACYDAMLGARVRDNCPDCYNTGYLRGYHNPIAVWVQIDPSAKSQQNNALQTQQVVMTRARMSHYPEVVPGDLLVEGENRRWSVEKVETTERLRAVVQQILTLKEVEPTDIEYRLPIRLDYAIRDIQPSPVRMYENPATLEAAMRDRTPDAFALYPTRPRKKED